MSSNSVLGINDRNLNYVYNYNSKGAMALADDKIYTKKVLKKVGVPTPKLYAVIHDRRELNSFDWRLPSEFVLKPNAGFGGEGILVIIGKKGDKWKTTKNNLVTKDDLKQHIIEILEGNFSITGSPDFAFFEHRLVMHPAFKKVVYLGMPDVRVIVYKNIPIIAMARLPTIKSAGKANLHQGAVGAGINIVTGRTTSGVMAGKIVKKAPDTKQVIKGFQIPYWKKILEMAIKAQQASKLGYLGVDIVVDKKDGPMVLELNARPGLGIQVANLLPLKKMLILAENYDVRSVPEGIRASMQIYREVTVG